MKSRRQKGGFLGLLAPALGMLGLGSIMGGGGIKKRIKKKEKLVIVVVIREFKVVVQLHTFLQNKEKGGVLFGIKKKMGLQKGGLFKRFGNFSHRVLSKVHKRATRKKQKGGFMFIGPMLEALHKAGRKKTQRGGEFVYRVPKNQRVFKRKRGGGRIYKRSKNRNSRRDTHFTLGSVW